MMIKWIHDLGSYQEQTGKVVMQTNSEKEQRGSSTQSHLLCGFYFVASSLRDAYSFHWVSASKQSGQRSHSCHTVQAGTLKWEFSSRTVHMVPVLAASHRPASIRHSGTHHHLYFRKWTPCLPLSLFAGFSREQASMSKIKTVWV